MKPSSELSDHEVANLMINLAEWNRKLDVIVEYELNLDKNLLSLETEPTGYPSLRRRFEIIKTNFFCLAW